MKSNIDSVSVRKELFLEYVKPLPKPLSMRYSSVEVVPKHVRIKYGGGASLFNIVYIPK